jgi:hypothetical protein
MKYFDHDRPHRIATPRPVHLPHMAHTAPLMAAVTARADMSPANTSGLPHTGRFAAKLISLADEIDAGMLKPDESGIAGFIGKQKDNCWRVDLELAFQPAEGFVPH